MEYFILMIALFVILVVMKVLSQGIELVQIIFFIVWLYFVWKFYPYAFSKSDKWRASPLALLINRFVALGFAAYAFIYVMGLNLK